MTNMIRRNNFIKIFLAIILFAAPLMPLVAQAGATSVSAPNIWPAGWWAPNGIVSCTGMYYNGTTENPNACSSLIDLEQTIVNVIYLGMSIAIFIIAPVLFLVGAIMLIMGGANPEMLSKGRQTMIDTVIGLLIVLCSYLIITTVISVFHISGIGGFSVTPSTVTTP